MSDHHYPPALGVERAIDDACECEDASASYAECGQPQTWECDVWGGCHRTWEAVKAHRVSRHAFHAADCDTPRIPESWCSCVKVVTMMCGDCCEEFPADVTPSDTVEIW